MIGFNTMGRDVSDSFRGYKAMVLETVMRAFGLSPKHIRKTHYNGRQKIMTIVLKDNVDRCENHHDRCVTVDEGASILRRWCGVAMCPCGRRRFISIVQTDILARAKVAGLLTIIPAKHPNNL